MVDDEVTPLRGDRVDRRVMSLGALRYSVAYGSNACPSRLMDKGLTSRGAVLLPAVVRGWVPAFEARRTGYGAVPLTFVPSPDAVTSTWVLGLPPEDLALLDRTEGRVADGTPGRVGWASPDGRFAPPGAYQLGRVGDVEVAGGFLLRGALAYLPGPSTRVQRVAGRWRTWPEHDQDDAVRHIDEAGERTPAPPIDEVVLGPWPTTPLQRLPR